ncbi:transmembrane protein 17A isoform X2 [Corythoichthys intestinalis]|uniref:transmembrane protein 17A isoform X2 n=1 Tax=Corythoichthys intestinalis TaxID=161448 RepID=UPI0025A53491|nr:transmembrane protein 17A isoform X2 [Corythoichthys intestinalis]
MSAASAVTFHLHGQMLIYFNLFYLPLWCLSSVCMLEIKFVYLPGYYQGLLITGIVLVTILELLRLYLGYFGNLEENPSKGAIVTPPPEIQGGPPGHPRPLQLAFRDGKRGRTTNPYVHPACPVGPRATAAAPQPARHIARPPTAHQAQGRAEPPAEAGDIQPAHWCPATDPCRSTGRILRLRREGKAEAEECRGAAAGRHEISAPTSSHSCGRQPRERGGYAAGATAYRGQAARPP